jgi:acyl phosphate:glycerol-3-phosphate acyltransferase
MQTYATVAIVSYLLGSIPFGYILVRLFLKTDVRTLGSGNIGATNVGRTGHRGLAIGTLLLDAGKGAAAVVGTLMLFLYAATHDPQWTYALLAFAAMCAVLGHVFPVWLKFKGGKGVATAIGAFAFLAPRAALAALAVFVIVVAITRYVSLGSILGAISFPIAAYLLSEHASSGDKLMSLAALGYVSATSALVILKHRQNIRRLFAGTEPKLGAKVKLHENPVQTEKNA